jgi:putative sigma-54 modulation protein
MVSRGKGLGQVDVEIAGRHVKVTDAMESHIQQRIEHLPKFADSVQYLEVTLDVDSGNQLVEVLAKCGRADLVAEATSHDMYQSIDEAFARIERQLTRYHDKIVNGRSREAQKASREAKSPE